MPVAKPIPLHPNNYRVTSWLANNKSLPDYRDGRSRRVSFREVNERSRGFS